VVEPLFVVDDADQRLLRGHLRQQTEHGQPHQEPVRRRTGAHAERGQQRVVLRPGQPPGMAQDGATQLMQPGEGQLHLRLHARRVRHPAPLGLVDQVAQQRRLAHARNAAQHQGPALTGTDGSEQPVEHLAFAAAVRQPCRASSDPGIRSHPPGTTSVGCGRRPFPGRRTRRE
jgi:hypothetical protein